MYTYPYLQPNPLSKGLSLIKNIKWGNLLDGTSKTLGIINQAIPLIYQVKPIINNTKILFKIADSVKNTNNDKSTIKNNNSNKPIFYI